MKRRIFLFLIITFTWGVKAQVGIGTNTPDSKSMLDVVSEEKGILIPRMTEYQRNSIVTGDAQDGLMVYNTSEDCFNYWNKLEDVWSSICGKLGKAIFTLDCSKVAINGQYLNNVALTSDNKLLVTVNVTKAGSYTINAIASPDNKYFFSKSGDFLSTGIYTIEIPGYGTPENFTPNVSTGDKFTITLNSAPRDTPCTFDVVVQDSSVKPEFRMDCTSSIVKGTYQKDKPLDATNYIEVTIRFDASVNGAPLRIYTDTVDGISFDSESLKLDSQGQVTGWVTQKVQLYGTGSPTSYTSKLMTLHSNSTTSSTTCQVSVMVGYPKMTLYGNGGGIYNIALSGQLNSMATSSANYGMNDNSTVKFQGWNAIQSGGDNASAATMSAALLGANPPDIVVFGYSNTRGADLGAIIKQYLDKGGVVICYIEGLTSTTNFLQAIFGTGVSAGYIGGSGGQIYTYRDIDDPVLNGPFGDLRGANWGEDSSATQGVTGLDSNFIAYTSLSGSVTAFRHKKYNFIFVGDGGFNSGVLGSNSTAMGSYPFATTLAPDYRPIARPALYGTTALGGPATVSNSVFTANALAWALEMATVNGINRH